VLRKRLQRTTYPYFTSRICVLLSLFFIIGPNVLYATENTHKNVDNFLNQYYEARKNHNKDAKHFLELAIKAAPDDIRVRKEMGAFLLQQKQPKEALKHFKHIVTLDPKDQHTIKQIRYIKVTLAPRKKTVRPAETVDSLLNKYYEIRKNKRGDGENFLKAAVKLDPKDLRVRKEFGMLLLEKKRPEEALEHFTYLEERDSTDVGSIKQSGYILESLGRHTEAYVKFEKVFELSKDSEEKKKLYETLVNLSTFRTKVLPSPFFAEIYYSPLYENRFGNTINSMNTRLGVVIEPTHEWEVYVGTRFNKDKKSIGGTAPAIYSDNSVIYAVGMSLKPISSIPIKFYVESGYGHDVTSRNRPSNRKDLRGGVVGFQNWGAKPVYSDILSFPFKHIGDAQGDVSYYSRYDNNWIGTFRIREGLRVLAFKGASVNCYAKGQFLFDTNKEFFNNLYEYGAGIAVQPTYLTNFVIRTEKVWGNYIKVNSRSPNPYAKKYRATSILAEFFVRI